ncbi:uncharacterized protein [Lolium perenne]|uniref:uncharacterized protein n=1 Tax=Lolium perenne TaxID=4522 RepID=UPI003A9A1772
MAAANLSGLTSPVGGAGAGREGGIEGEGGEGELGNLGGLLSVVDSSNLPSATAAAGAGRDGDVDGEGGAGAGREDGVDGEVADLGGQVAADVDCCGSSNPSTLMVYSPEKAATTAVAKVCKENPASSSRFTSGFVGGIDLHDEIWDVRFNLDGQDNLERCLGRSDMTYLNLLAIIELEGYGINDCMYFVKEKDIGVAGMEELDGMSKVEQMIELYEEKKCINISVIKRGSSLPVNINKPAVEEQIPMSEIGDPIVYTVDDDGVVLPSQEEIVQCTDDSAMLYLCTQQSNIDDKDDEEEEIAEGCSDDEQEEIAEDREESSDDEQDGDFMEEDEVETESDEETELNEKLIDLKKRKRGGTKELCEDEEPEDIFCDSDNCDDDTDCEVLQETVAVTKKKLPVRKGPTTRSHCSQQSTTPADWLPSDDEGQDGELNPEDDDGFETMSWVLPKGRKSRAKKMDPRVWYDESRLHPEQVIKHEKTLCLRKCHLEHTCGTSGEHCKVTGKWVAKVCESSIRIDLRTGVEAVMETTKEKYGVDVKKMMAYRAKKKAVQVVIGDQIEQYRRLRDYLQTVIDTNPGSRYIVTTKMLLEHPSKNPRFHGLFYCLGASIEGFLKGCRPFFGLDGCFVKLTTGQQILCATGRDGNNNLFPIAFGLVYKEETASWSWFLTQVKYALGGEAGKFGYYTIISDRQKGLLNAINQIFPNCPQRYCLRHIYANFQTAGFRGEELKKFMDAASYSYTQHGFDVAMANMKEECLEAWEWLMKIPVATWARYAMDYNCKTDLVVNNLSEVFNRMILDVRGKPVRTMFDGIRKKLMVRNDEKRTGAAKARWVICPTYAKILEENKKWSRMYRSKKSVDGLWEVTNGTDKTYAVNLTARTCGCKRWDLSGIPCSHAVSAIYKAFLHPEDFVNDFFKKQMYMEAYNPVVYPVPGEDSWTKTETPDIDPPVFKVSLGRSQKKRRKRKFEVPEPKQTSRMASITCGNCGKVGHRYTNSGVPLKPSLQMRKNKHQV